MHPYLSLTSKSANQAFTTEEQSLESTATKSRENRYAVLKGIFKSDDVTCIDDVVIRHIDLQNRPIGIEKDIPNPTGFEQYQPLSAEKTFGSLPLATDLDPIAIGHISTALQVERPASEPVVLGVSEVTRSKEDLARPILRSERVDDHALATHQTSKRLQGTTLETRLELHVRGHGCHGRWLGMHFLALLQGDLEHGKIRPHLDFVLKCRCHTRGVLFGFEFRAQQSA